MSGAFVTKPQRETVADSQWIKGIRRLGIRNPTPYSINGYSAPMVLAEGVKKANSLDAGKIGKRLTWRDGGMLAGKLTYGARGDLTDPTVHVFQVRTTHSVQVTPGCS